MELEKRYFSLRNIRSVLRKLSIGIDNRYLAQMVGDGTLPEPEINEFTVKLWSYYRVVQLIRVIYKLKGKEDMFNTDRVRSALGEVKEEIKKGKDEI